MHITRGNQHNGSITTNLKVSKASPPLADSDQKRPAAKRVEAVPWVVISGQAIAASNQTGFYTLV
jgi:hypothetical protein